MYAYDALIKQIKRLEEGLDTLEKRYHNKESHTPEESKKPQIRNLRKRTSRALSSMSCLRNQVYRDQEIIHEQQKKLQRLKERFEQIEKALKISNGPGKACWWCGRK